LTVWRAVDDLSFNDQVITNGRDFRVETQVDRIGSAAAQHLLKLG
jgi:hypothetical protein